MKIIGQRTKSKTKLHTLVCEVCSDVFGAYYTAKRCCSTKCAGELNGRGRRSGENRVCERCSGVFYSKKSEDRRGSVRSFCSLSCRRLDPSIPIGRYISYDGYWILTARSKQLREHRVVYEKAFGPIPKGYVIHHINHNKLDNSLSNLMAMSRSEHNKIHKAHH